MELPTFADVEEAAVRIAPYVRRTPLLRSDVLDAATGATVFVKAECLQRFGAFKARGAFNKIASLDPRERGNGVLAFSSGNHGQAVAGAAKTFGVPAVIVMPADAPAVKREGVAALGGELVLYDRLSEDREAIGARIAMERSLTIVRPFDDPHVIAGQGTAALEVLEEVDGVDIALAPTSGGGLLTGTALSVKARFPEAKVFGVEPVGHEDAARSLAAGERVANAPGVRSICDALLSDRLGAIPFALAQRHVAGAVAVPDSAAEAAMRFAFRELRLVLEPSGAMALAAALSGAVDIRGARVALIASGGNVEPAQFARVLAG